MTEVWKKITAFSGSSVFKSITQHNGELICNPNEIADTLVRYAKVSGTERVILSISLQGKMKSNTTLTLNVNGTEVVMCLSG